MSQESAIILQVPLGRETETVRLEPVVSRMGRDFYARPGTEDAGVFACVVDENEYKLPARFAPDDVVIDVGAHIGSFSYAVLSRGAGKVYAYEAHPTNHAVASKNLERFGARAVCRNKAVWRSDHPPVTLYNNMLGEHVPTGGISVLWNEAGVPVESVSLDEIIEEATEGLQKTIRLLKLDCEGSEYPILFTSKHLGRVREICGEYHELERGVVPERAKVEGYSEPFGARTLQQFFESLGWPVEVLPTAGAYGLFFARQPAPSQAEDSALDIERLKAEIREAAHRRSSQITNAPPVRASQGDGSTVVIPPPTRSTTRREAAQARASDSGGARQPDAPQLILQADFHPSEDGRYHVNDLLQYHDKLFVRNAYRAILKREPDEEGFRQQLELLRGGRFDKIDLLAALASSPEARGKRVHVEGLARPARIRKLGRLPVVGYLFRLLFALVRLPALVREQQQFAAYVTAQHQQFADFINPVMLDISQSRRHLETLIANQAAQFNAQAAAQAAAQEQLRRQQQADREAAQAQAAEIVAHVQREQESLVQLVEERVRQFAQRLQQTRAELTAQEGRLSMLLEEARRRLPEKFDEQQLQTFADEAGFMRDALYLALEDAFRGTRGEIKERLKIYLPFVKRTPPTGALVDLGCGRGEWLEVLKHEGIGRAVGVDQNRIMIEQCRERGFEVIESDALSYLQSVGDASLRAVTGFHFAEHLPFPALVRVVDEALRALAPGGVLIFETPNPENMVVGSCNFYLDPDHRNPIPPPTLRFLFESRGLARVEILRLNANDAARVRDERSDLALRFNDFMYGPLDYAVVGWKV
jgi:O-antigen chain-terminating methyltransferase